jgi:hypothetical protein
MLSLDPAAATRIMQRYNSGRTEAYPIAPRTVKPPRFPLDGTIIKNKNLLDNTRGLYRQAGSAYAR